MATEIQFGPSLNAAVATQGAAPEESNPFVQQQKQPAPILGGENVMVTSGAVSDLEKLVARLKSEDDETRTSLTKMRLSAVGAALDAANVRLTAEQAAALDDMVLAESERTALKAELAQIYERYGITDDASAKAIMDAKIKSLEQAIERAVQEGKDHNEAVEKEKKRLEEELAKAQAAAARIPVVQSGIAGATAKITEDIKILGPGKLNEIAVALEKVAEGAEAPDERTSEAERKKEEEKEIAFDPLKAIREALDKIDEAILQTIEENTTINA